jgi:hypothetical protein
LSDNLKQKTNESVNKSIDDPLETASSIYEDAKVAAQNAIKNAGAKEEIVSDTVKPLKIGDPNMISDLNLWPAGPDQN